MEENTFLDQNPQFTREYNQNLPNGANNTYMGARNSEIEAGGIKRLFNPGIAEAAQFDRENYFMDKENAFNEYMFNKANQYNSAAAQMERAIEAGINPNLAAAGIMSAGNDSAMPMQGAKGDVGMNTNTLNPTEQLANLTSTIATGINSTNELGTLLGFGEKNKAEINLIKENAKKAMEEGGFTRAQKRQLQAIGGILVDNAKLQGKEIEQNIENLKRLNEVYQQQKWNLAADTNLKTAETGVQEQSEKSLFYDNLRKEYEKTFRDMFGAELTHDKLQFLVEAALHGKGEVITNFLIDTTAGVIKGIKNKIKDNIKTPKLKPKKTPEQIHLSKNQKAAKTRAKLLWTNNFNIRSEYKGNFEKFLNDYIEMHENDTLYAPADKIKWDYFGDLK